MVRYLLTVAGAVAIMSNFAFAEAGTFANTKTKVVTQSAPAGVAHKKVVIKRHGDRYGALVAKKKVVKEGMSGSSMSRTRMVSPGAGGITVKKRTIVRR